MTAPIIEFDEVSKRFEGVVAVEGATFDVQPGEILSVLGPSGCGKTTVLRLIAGFETPDTGEIAISGKAVANSTVNVPPERRNVGLLFQEYALFPHLTVEQNVSFGLQRLDSADRLKNLADVMDLVRLTGLERRYPHELSGGQQQRVALARTLAPRPVTVLLDEPFSNVDASLRAEMRGEVEAILRGNNISTVFVTHDREEAFAMADRVAVMHEGRIDQIGTPDQVYHSPSSTFVARISGTADFLAGVIEEGWVSTEVGRLPWASGDESIGEGTLVHVLVHMDDFQVQYSSEGKATVASREFRGDETVLRILTPSGAVFRCRRGAYNELAPGTSVRLSPATSRPFVVFRREGGGP